MFTRIALTVLIAFTAGILSYGLGALLITVNQPQIAALGAMLVAGCTIVGVIFGAWFWLTGRTEL